MLKTSKKIKNIFFILTVPIFYTACSYTSPEALKIAKKDDFKLYTYNTSISDVEKKVEEYMQKCHHRNKETITTSVNGSVTEIDSLQPSDYVKKIEANSIQFYIHINKEFYTFGAEITTLDKNMTNLKVYANNFIWFANSYKIDEYIKTNKLECSKL